MTVVNCRNRVIAGARLRSGLPTTCANSGGKRNRSSLPTVTADARYAKLSSSHGRLEGATATGALAQPARPARARQKATIVRSMGTSNQFDAPATTIAAYDSGR